LQANLLNRAKESGGIVLIEDSYYQTASNQRLPTKDFFISIKSKGNDQQLMRVRWIVRPSQMEKFGFTNSLYCKQKQILMTSSLLCLRKSMQTFLMNFAPISENELTA